MKLGDYMKANDLGDADMAAKVACSRTQINRIRRGVTEPSFSLALAIERATSGEVPPADLAAPTAADSGEAA